MYEMLVGIPPYYANSREQLFYNIENGILKIPSNMSEEAKSLLKAVNDNDKYNSYYRGIH